VTSKLPPPMAAQPISDSSNPAMREIYDKLARHAAERPKIEAAGEAALRRLYDVACRDSGQCRYVARFLLGLYNSQRFPFKLTDLRGLDDALFDDCMAVLRMDARVTAREVHKYFDDGGRKFERLAKNWNVEDMEQVQTTNRRKPPKRILIGEETTGTIKMLPM